jgi:hypothetical protein
VNEAVIESVEVFTGAMGASSSFITSQPRKPIQHALFETLNGKPPRFVSHARRGPIVGRIKGIIKL